MEYHLDQRSNGLMIGPSMYLLHSDRVEDIDRILGFPESIGVTVRDLILSHDGRHEYPLFFQGCIDLRKV